MPDKSVEREYIEAFGKSLKNLRISVAKKSLRMFSYEADIPCATLSRLENGTRIANIITLKRIAAEMNCSVSDLLKEIERTIPENIKNFDM